jgi:hypothetical protein
MSLAKRGRPLPRATVLVLALFLLTGCSITNSSRPDLVPSPRPLGAPDCKPPSPEGLFALEREGTAHHGTLWAYLMPTTGLPIRSGQDTKIVWRYSIPHPAGDASISFSARDTNGTAAILTFGPTGHGDSNWNRPGYEVGTGFLFPEAGCWDIHADAVGMSGDLFLVVE